MTESVTESVTPRPPDGPTENKSCEPSPCMGTETWTKRGILGTLQDTTDRNLELSTEGGRTRGHEVGADQQREGICSPSTGRGPFGLPFVSKGRYPKKEELTVGEVLLAFRQIAKGKRIPEDRPS